MVLTTYVRKAGTLQTTVCLVSGVVAIWAFAGSLGLITGVIGLGADLDQRLPFRSPVFGGLMLAVVVGLPMTAAGVLAARDDERTPIFAMVAGLALIGWIAVQIAVIREFSVLQPICVLLGLIVLAVGAVQFRVGHRHSSEPKLS
ncbi:MULTISPECIES: hypothetical protein [Nocardia]|uniref:Integral membrane protein n=1 Tax=Nocardia brasiliensis (strain ATCC 700358 / HUJEG-1) TaxID=1133849 RepID=K0EXJ7_NOCB7|nr:MULTISPECIES: hypothetical protein [Nocardia]AFU01615.1 hypothetical protein O3I_018280 [Nocardia brasiliensis ATCC 700358]OCF85810.1 hypothetical protein AW168_33705 [Nocardia brasiliensis]